LRNLTIIDWALQTINRQQAAKGLPPVDINRIPLDDKPSYDLLKAQKTTAVFQLESRGMKDLIRRLQPDVFEDIIALVALFRPGPLQSGMVDDFINRKKGIAAIEYPHPSLEQILKPTYGVIVYQEQVMQIAQVLASYTLGGADMLRRAMGKKKPEEMAKQRSIFMEGARSNNIDDNQSGYIFDLMEKFAEYGFNKCIVADTRIMHAVTGEITTVGELYKQPREFVIHALGNDWQLHKRQVVDVMANGAKPVYELFTRSGKRITATANHPFRTWRGWQQLGDLSIGERIAVPRVLDVHGSNHWQNYELITLAGLLSEGNTCHPSSLYFYNNKREMIDDFAQAVSQFPNTHARIYQRANGRFEVCVNTGYLSRFQAGQVPWNAHSNCAMAQVLAPIRSGAYLWAQDLELLGKKALEKQVPAIIFTLNNSQLALFLGRLWSGDGFVSNAQLHVPFYATSSRQLADDVQLLLLRLGIPSRIHTKYFNYKHTKRIGFTVNVLGETGVVAFVEHIAPHLIGREMQLAELTKHLNQTTCGLTSKDTVPAEIRQWVADERLRLGITWQELETRSGVSMKEFTGNGSILKQGFRRSTIAKLGDFFVSERLKQIANAAVFWDSVVAIEPRGIQETYDLTVQHDHNFVANGIIVHNSHSAAYALVAFQTAWLKAHYPAAFMAAVLSADMDNTDKVVTLLDDCRQLNLTTLPPDINRSDFQFTVDEQNRIIYGLGALKGAGEAALSVLLQERQQNGLFKSLSDVCKRANSQKVNKRVLETLIKSGAFDSLGGTRRAMLAFLPEAMRMAEQHYRDQLKGQTDLFGGMFGGALGSSTESMMPDLPEFPEKDRLQLEKETLGLYLTGHPLDEYKQEIEGLPNRMPLADLAEDEHTKYKKQAVMLAGLVSSIRTQNTDNGKRAFVQLDDNTAYYEALIFTDTYAQYAELLEKANCVVIEGVLDTNFSGKTRLKVEKIHNMQSVRENFLRRVYFKINHAQQACFSQLKPYLIASDNPKHQIIIDYQGVHAKAELRLGNQWQVALSDEQLKAMREILDKDQLRLVF
jgi:DNA polymerase-3 subunit alpha